MSTRRRGRRLSGLLARLALAIALLAIILALIPPAPLSAQVGAPRYGVDDPVLPWLRTANGRIVDDRGRTVLLRGFNVSALVRYPDEPPAPFDETDATLMQRAGFSVVRLAIDWAQLESVRGQIDRRYLERVAEAVRVLNRQGLYVVLDMHIRLGFSPRFGASGAPEWAAVPLLPNWNVLPGLSWGRAVDPAAAGANAYFWLSDDWKADFYRVWQAVAQRFRDTSGIAGYDLYNEPNLAPIPPVLFEKYWLWPFYRRTIEAIGAEDPNHLFFVQGILLLSLGTAVVPLRVPNLVYGAHTYVGSLLAPFWSGDRRPVAAKFDDVEREAKALPAPLWVGEFGIDLTRESAVPWTDAMMDEVDQRGLGWAWWQWRQNRYWGIRDASGTELNTNFLRHLARPYLAAAPAGVTAGRGDGVSGRLAVTVDARHGDAPVLVGWSALTLSGPRVTGGCVQRSQWDPLAGRLTLELKPDRACQVTLEAG